MESFSYFYNKVCICEYLYTQLCLNIIKYVFLCMLYLEICVYVDLSV